VVHLGNSVVSSGRRNRITEDSESSARWALSRCKGCTKEELCCEFREETESLRILRALPGGH
jgi:hypothetical protein